MNQFQEFYKHLWHCAVIAWLVLVILLIVANVQNFQAAQEWKRTHYPGIMEVGSTTITDEEFISMVNYQPNWWGKLWQ